MRVGDLSTGVSKLREAKLRLERAWQGTREQWDDETSRNFEAMHLRQLLEEVSAALTATKQFSGILAQAKRDCEAAE